MSSYSYEAVDPAGAKITGMLDVSDQSEALKRIKEMGLFPTKIAAARERWRRRVVLPRSRTVSTRKPFRSSLPFIGSRVKPKVLTTFTRQLATLIEAGMPLLRGLRTLSEQQETPAMKRMLDDLSASIESGLSLSEALAAHPQVFNTLYVNMVRAGEVGGALEVVLRRLAEFREKSQKIRGRVKAALYYPVSVMTVAVGIIMLLMVYVIPKFQDVFNGLFNGKPMPDFTIFVMNISDALRHHFFAVAMGALAVGAAFQFLIHTKNGRLWFDRLKLRLPIVGPLCRKVAISRFSRTLGTLLSNGVPILQALTIVKETTGNVSVSRAVANVHDSVKEGETIATPLRASGIFPAMVVGMVDIGEQTGALPDMLLKIAETYDEEVDTSVTALTSLLEPIMIVFLAVIVGAIVIAVFLPIIEASTNGFSGPNGGGDM